MAELAVTSTVLPEGATPETRPDLFGTRGQFARGKDGGLITFVNDNDKPEYATPEASGISDGFYVGSRGLPWHVALSRQLGTAGLMRDAGQLLTAKQAVAAAGGFEVGLDPITRAGTDIVIPGKWTTYRKDTGEPLGVVGRSYKIFQEEALANFAVDLVDSGEASFETGGHMRGGAWFFLSMELGHLDITVPGDPSPLQTYLLLQTSHDGSKPASWRIVRVRTVCRNTQDLATKGAITSYILRHSSTMEGRLAEVRRVLGISFRNTEIVKALAGQLAAKPLTDRQVEKILEKSVWPIKAAEDGDAEAERKSRHIDRAFENYLSSTTLEGIRGTAWGAYQSVIEYLDHEVAYHGRARQDDSDARADSLLNGTGADTKTRALAAFVGASK